MIREKDEQRWEIAALYNHENVRPYSIGKVFEKLTLGEFYATAAIFFRSRGRTSVATRWHSSMWGKPERMNSSTPNFQ